MLLNDLARPGQGIHRAASKYDRIECNIATNELTKARRGEGCVVLDNVSWSNDDDGGGLVVCLLRPERRHTPYRTGLKTQFTANTK